MKLKDHINITHFEIIKITRRKLFIEHNNTLITDPNRIANTFNDYFANIGSDSASNICADGNIICLRSRNVLENLRKYPRMTLLIKWTT